MRRLAGFLLIFVSLSLAGCGRQGSGEHASGEGQKEVGGYAGDLAAPPAKAYEPGQADVEANIKAGLATDTKEKIPEPTPEEKAKAAEEAKKAADEAKKAAAAPKSEPKPAGKPGPKNTSGDAKHKQSSKPVVAMQTKHGVVYMELWPETAPKTVKAICKLAREKFYDGIIIHRVEPGFVVQFGDPITKKGGLSDPAVGTGGPGFTIDAEFSKTLKHTKGILSMARSQDVNSAGSQMFIVLGDAPFLDGQYSIFGKVLGDGMAQVDKITVGDVVEYLWVVRDLPEGKR